jgi:hypothetical protein
MMVVAGERNVTASSSCSGELMPKLLTEPDPRAVDASGSLLVLAKNCRCW